MSRPVYMFRPNMKIPDQRKVWEILQRVPKGQKNEYVAKALLQQARSLKSTSPDAEPQSQAPSVREKPEAIPKDMLGFLGNLLDTE